MRDRNKPFDVFISHSSQDGQTAAAIKSQLSSAGLQCWMAPDDVHPGESWPSAISRALHSCRVMVLVWSHQSQASKEVAKELTIAMRNGVTVIPFRIENVSPSGEWEFHLANTHWMDAFPGDLGPYIAQLGSKIRGLASAESPADQPVISPRRTTNNRKHRTWVSPLHVAGVLVAAGIVAALLLYRLPPDQPAPTSANQPPVQDASVLLQDLHNKVVEAEKEKLNALRLAAERETEAQRLAVRQAELEKEAALQKAADAERQMAAMARATPATSERRGTISDPDGFTNVRLGPGTRTSDGREMPIVGRILRGETFEFVPSKSDWWKVRLDDGTEGFVHSSRIVFIPQSVR